MTRQQTTEMPVSPKAKLTTESCFVIMPFGGHWDEYYRQIYHPAILDAGIQPVRADDSFGAGSMLKDIVEILSKCSLVLADITDVNRNVHYELGLAHALGKPTVLVAPEEMNLFFDIGQERLITYSQKNAFWGDHLRRALTKAVQETVANPSSAIPTVFMHVRPSRLQVDETTLRMRRIEELLSELIRVLTASADGAQPSRLRTLLKGLPAAEDEAERLLASCGLEDAVRSLVIAGYGQYMAETAVSNAAARMGKA
jgi:nucleoside 2-deoxyribosyltransferase